MRNLIWFAAGAFTVTLIAGLSGLIYLKERADGFSARSDPTYLETIAAKTARGMAMSASAREQRNPVSNSQEVLAEAAAHWADHCAVCHGNNGGGAVDMGPRMYPHSPDMRKQSTQALTDGELYYIIENGIRLTGMPAWGGTAAGEKASWELVHFIRHLPDLSAAEIARMEKLNPKGPEDREMEREEEQFLNGRTPGDAPIDTKHNKEK